MAIIFHCNYCGKKIEAKDGSGGRWGKCPSCHNKIYVPEMSGGEELKLAPLDEAEEQRKKRLMAETFQLEQSILRQKEIAEGVAAAEEQVPKLDRGQLNKKLVEYLVHMSNGNLDAADGVLVVIRKHKKPALELLDAIALNQIPEPELAHIPQGVLSGLIRGLRGQLT